MRHKKLVSALLVIALMFVLSTSAFAATGVGDTRNDAITLIDNTMYSLYISDANDKDWFEWTNNTGKAKFVMATLYPTAPGTSLNLAAIIDFGNGSESSVINGERSTPTNGMHIRGLYVPNGGKLYVRIGNDLSTLTQYKFNILSYDM